MARMTEQQRAAYKIYKKECRMSNVEPVRADFLGIELSYEEMDRRALRAHRQIERQRVEADALAMGASVGA